MSSGAFLKERKNAQASAASENRGNGEQKSGNKKKHRRRSRQQTLLIMLIVVLLAVLAAMLLWLNSNPLIGKWNMDDVTAYEFGRNGKGTMILPSSEYEFRYQNEGNTLYIDFVDENAKDAEYSFEISGDILTLNGGNATTRGVYTLIKEG